MAWDKFVAINVTLDQFNARLDAAEAGGTPTPTPAPTFTTQPTISPSSGTAGTTSFTATSGTVSNGAITSRAWLLNGTSISTGTTAAPQAAGTLTYQEFATGAGGSAQSVVRSVTVSATPTPTPTPTPGTLPAASRPASYTPTFPINYMADSTGAGVGAPAGSDPVTQLRALYTAGATSPFNLLGSATTVTVANVGQGGVGGENSANGLTRVQYVNTNYPGQMARTWVYSFGLNDYLLSVTPQTRQWADNVKANAASVAALIPSGNEPIFLLTPAEQNVGPGQQFSADHVFHRRDMRATFGWRAIDQVRALRLLRQEDTSTPIISGGADEKALSMGIVPYTYRGTGLYGSIVNGTDYPDGDRIPSINATAPSNTTDLGFDPGSLWYHNNGASPVMYRKTGANGSGGWALSDTKHQGRVGYSKVALIVTDADNAIEGKTAFAPPVELRCPVDAAASFVIGTVPIKGTVSSAGIYNPDGSQATQVAISTAGVVTRTGIGTILDGVTELVGALVHSSGTVTHFAVDLFGTRAASTAPAFHPIASPGVAVVARANHGMSNTTAFSFAMYLSVTTLTSAPTIMLFNRSANLSSSPTTPTTPITVTLTTGGAPRFTVRDSTDAIISNSLITSGAAFTAGTPGWLFVALDFAGNVRTIYVADATSERTGTLGAVTSGTVPINDALPSFLMGAAPTQYYDGVTPLVGGIGYIGFWDSYVDWTNAANRRALASASGVPVVRTPYAALPSGPAPKLEIFGSKGDWLYGTPDGSNGPQTLAISHRARALMS